MNSDKAAAVRDSINGCPMVVGDDDLRERDGAPHITYRGGTEVTLTGDYVKPTRSRFSPATIKQSGTLGDGEGAERPVFVVELKPLWCDPGTAISLSPEMVYEAAKHDCRLRFYPADHHLGRAVWVVDRFTEDLTNTDGDRCPECDSTYFKIRDGTPECARCGATEKTTQTKLTEMKV